MEAPSTAGLALETAGHGPVTRLLCDSLLLSANWRAAPAERAFTSFAGPVPILGVTWESWLTSLSSHCLSVPCPHQPDCRALGEAIDHRRHAVPCLGQQANLIPPLTLLKIFFFNGSFIKIQFTYRTIHPFKVYEPVVFRVFPELSNCHHNRFQNMYFTPRKKTRAY